MQTSTLEPWQIPSRPRKDPPNFFARILFRLVHRIVDPLYHWYVRMDGESQIDQLGAAGSRPDFKGPIYLYNPENIRIGRDVGLNRKLWIIGAGGVEIGNHVHFGENVRILTQNHNYENPDCLPYDK